jgi:hypothetical protein
MSALLKPLKGNFGGIKSLEDYAICRDDEGKLVLRFSIAIANVGMEDLHIVLGELQQIDGKTFASAKQIIKQDDGETREVDVGLFERNEEQDGSGHSHVHWHYPNLASLALVNESGEIVASSKKEGYCVIDSFRYPNFSVIRDKQFSHDGCERRSERGIGITVGWCDYYKYDTDRQFIEIDNVPPGQYRIVFTINKTKMIYEVDEPVSIEISIKEEDKMITQKCEDI